MKANFTRGWWRAIVVLLIALTAFVQFAEAQLPDCATGGTIYAIFNRDSTNSTIADSSEIRPINATTGVVGGLMGGKRYWIRKVDPSNSSIYYYGSSAMGVDMITNRFYVMTQMSPSMGKDIITIDPVGGTMTTIGTTPSSVNTHHFVKLAISPNGNGYALGVARSSATGFATYNPLIRFTTCGAVPTAGCSVITLLGYLPAGPNMYKAKLYNGDIAFDTYGNMFFLTVAFDSVGSQTKYTNSRLFRINAADIPTSGGTGIIPMTFVADYDIMDTTAVNGIGLDNAGNMMLATRRFLNTSTNPSRPWISEIYMSNLPGSATIMPGFVPPTGQVIADLASCYFPMTILGGHKIQLQYKYENALVNLKWKITNNDATSHFEIQRSDDGANFETIVTVPATNPDQATATYTYADPQNGFDKNKFYRIKQVLRANGSARYYSEVVSINFNHKISLIAGIKPNPFNSHIELNVWLRNGNTINVRMRDQNGRTVRYEQINGKTGENKVVIEHLGKLNSGVYIVEMAVQDQVIREKVIKQ